MARRKNRNNSFEKRIKQQRQAERLTKQAQKQTGRLREKLLIQAKMATASKKQQKQIKKSYKRDSLEENRRKTKAQEAYFRIASKTTSQHDANIPKNAKQRLARAQQSFFYAATRVFWRSGSIEQRNENIVAALQGVILKSGRPIQNLQDAVEYVREQYAGSYPTMQMVIEGKVDTEGNLTFLQEIEERDPSPKPISRKQIRSVRVNM